MMTGFQAEENLTGRAPKKCAKNSGRYPPDCLCAGFSDGRGLMPQQSRPGHDSTLSRDPDWKILNPSRLSRIIPDFRGPDITSEYGGIGDAPERTVPGRADVRNDMLCSPAGTAFGRSPAAGCDVCVL